MSLNMEVELERRLTNWAYWIICFERNEIGYPSKATIADFGMPNSYIRTSKPPFPLNNIQADEINTWINIMGEIRPECKVAIATYYLRKNGLRIYQIAKALNITLTMFNRHLHDGKTWLMGRLSSILDKKDQKNC